MDDEYMLKKLPEELSLDEKKVQRLAEELAKDKKRTILVQAISNLRQRNPKGVAAALNNLAVAYKLVPGESEKWGDRTEVLDLFSVYVSKVCCCCGGGGVWHNGPDRTSQHMSSANSGKQRDQAAQCSTDFGH